MRQEPLVSLVAALGLAAIGCGHPREAPNAPKNVTFAGDTIRGRLGAADTPELAGSGTGPLLDQARRDLKDGRTAEAASGLAIFARSNPSDAAAPDALYDSFVLRLRLDQYDEAVRTLSEYRKYFGLRDPLRAGRMEVAMAVYVAHKGRFVECNTHVSQASSVLDRLPLDVRLEALATSGRCQSWVAQADGAMRAYEQALSLWSENGEPWIKAAEPQAQRRALEAVAEAMFYEAEREQRRASQRLPFPRYEGASTKAAVQDFVRTKVVEWLKSKREALEQVDRKYLALTRLVPASPPRWVTAAGARSGMMWSDFADEFWNVPIPASFQKDPEVRNAYYRALEEMLEPVRVRVVYPRLEHCVRTSSDYKVASEFGKACGDWLATHKARASALEAGSEPVAPRGFDQPLPHWVPKQER